MSHIPPAPTVASVAKRNSPWGEPPKGYIPGLGRGAAGFTTRSDIGNSVGGARDEEEDENEQTSNKNINGSRASEQRAAKLAANNAATTAASTNTSADPATLADAQEDDEADRIWQAIDDKMAAKRKRKRTTTDKSTEGDVPDKDNPEASDAVRTKLGVQFRDLKQELATLSNDDWLQIPDVAGDHSLKFKKKQQRQQEGGDTFTPLTDSLLESRQTTGTTLHTVQEGDGGTTTMALQGLGAARGTVLGMSLDKMSDSISGQTVVDPQGYLTTMATQSTGGALGAEQVGDINKARLLLKSVRDTNPKHGPGWIASARVEEAAGKLVKARKLIQEGCQACPDEEDVWLEAARLHPTEVAKTILATAVRRLPSSVPLFLKAAELEVQESAKKAVLRKALEANPNSITLWKAAVELEQSEDDAKVLLSVAVERVPHSVDLWLALARLETYDNARKVLNNARRALPTERSIWIAAAKLEESQDHTELVPKLIARAFSSLSRSDSAVVVTRAQWLTEAEQAEAAGAPLTCAALVRECIGMDVDDEDRQRTWADDAKGALARGSVVTARAILEHALSIFPTKRGLWMQAVDLERNHGTPEHLDEVLKSASERLPRVELFWLLRAKERWMAGDIDLARDILTQAFAANPDSERVWLAAAKLEWETGETERARVLLQRARERAPTERVYMKSALLERENGNYSASLDLVQQGLERYPKFGKLYMMAGQIYAYEWEPKSKSRLEQARKIFQKGLNEIPQNAVLWILASRLEESAYTFDQDGSLTAGVCKTKARSLLELGRLKNPKSPELWLESIRLERRANNAKLAETLMARALQDCPSSGELLAETILTAPRVEQKSKSTVAIKRCPESPLVIAAVASLFASERKTEKARKWLERAVVLNPDLGDSWARYYAFELEFGTVAQQQGVRERCVRAEPKHGEIWQSMRKDMSNRLKSIGDCLEMAAKVVTDRKSQK
eukprot:Nitzschia sp. Nitz4//scaffold257_size48314//42683//45577//NITZ4_007096-RA/size48314-processed-gene-0.38-mRNA-1//1//CDS//3329544469//7831//frame0